MKQRCRVVRSDDAAQAEVDGRLVAFNIQKGICYEFKGVGARVWALIAQPTRIAELCERLSANTTWTAKPANARFSICLRVAQQRSGRNAAAGPDHTPEPR